MSMTDHIPRIVGQLQGAIDLLESAARHDDNLPHVVMSVRDARLKTLAAANALMAVESIPR